MVCALREAQKKQIGCWLGATLRQLRRNRLRPKNPPVNCRDRQPRRQHSARYQRQEDQQKGTEYPRQHETTHTPSIVGLRTNIAGQRTTSARDQVGKPKRPLQRRPSWPSGAQGVLSTRAANGWRGCAHGTGRKLTGTRPRPRCVPTKLCVTPTCSGSGTPDNAKSLRYPLLFYGLIFEDCWPLIATRNEDFI